MTVHVLPIWEKNPYNCPEVNTTLNSGVFGSLSPFVLRVQEVTTGKSVIFENLWQYSKVYKYYVAEHGNPNVKWFKWRDAGWSLDRAVRYPMGKGAVPEYSYWNGERLGYIEARKRIYATIYAENVIKTNSYAQLEALYLESGIITLKDYDAYDHLKLGMTLKYVINNPSRIMGHAFVLAMMLEGVLEECLK